MHCEDICHIGMTEENGEIKGTAKLYPNGIKYLKEAIYVQRVENNKFLQIYEGVKFALSVPFLLFKR